MNLQKLPELFAAPEQEGMSWPFSFQNSHAFPVLSEVLGRMCAFGGTQKRTGKYSYPEASLLPHYIGSVQISVPGICVSEIAGGLETLDT